MADKKPISEEKSTAASYIVTFYQEILQLTHYYSLYYNTLMENKAKKQHNSENTEADINNIAMLIQNLRYLSNKLHIMYGAISIQLKKEKNQVLEEAMMQLNLQYSIDINQMKIIVEQYHVFLMNEIMKTILESSQDIMKNIYG